MKTLMGFTLVELAIVIVVIGSLLGGVLKGAELIKNAKVKSIENEYIGISTAIYGYQERYHMLPGDDTSAASRLGVTGCSGASCNNFKIDSPFDSTTTDDESRLLWLHLRNARLVTGDPSSQAQPEHVFLGIIGVATDTDKYGAPGQNTTIPGLFIGFTNIPGDIAIILETHGDSDLDPKVGNIQSDQPDYLATGAGTSATLHKIFYAIR